MNIEYREPIQLTLTMPNGETAEFDDCQELFNAIELTAEQQQIISRTGYYEFDDGSKITSR